MSPSSDFTKPLVGIDPGKHGALAFLYPTDVCYSHNIPYLGKEVDAWQLAALLREFPPVHAFLELVASRPGQGVASSFNFGCGFGTLKGVLATLAIPVTPVTPSKWKRKLGLPADKEVARKRASELFPDAAGQWATKSREGHAEAALIAYYGREVRQREGQA